MRLRGWLNEARVIAIPRDEPVTRDVVIGPLHDRGIQAAALDIGGFLTSIDERNRRATLHTSRPHIHEEYSFHNEFNRSPGDVRDPIEEGHDDHDHS